MGKNIIITESQFRALKESLLTEVRNMVDNFDLVGNLINLTDPDKFFFVQIVKRWKDNKDKGMNRAAEHNYHGGGTMGTFKSNTAFKVHSKAELDALKPQIISYCDANNARAYICCNPRSESVINNYLPTHLSKAARRNHGQVPDYEQNYGFEHLAGQPKNFDPVNFPDRLRFFLDIDCPEEAYFVPKTVRLNIVNNHIKDNSILNGLKTVEVESGAILVLTRDPQKQQALEQMGAINVWKGTKDILAKHNIPIETEYKTPSRGLHVVIADVSAIQNFAQVEQDLRIFDNGKFMGRVQLVHANMDGKLILYSNVDTAGY